jgi:hypothetical protein
VDERRYLHSPRFRRRLVKGGLLGAVVAGGALVSILFWNTANPVVYPVSNEPAQIYAPPIPVKMAAAERREIIRTASRFLDTAVRREHAERAYEIVSPTLRGGTTKEHWRTGDIPVVPYPVDAARWKFDYSYANEIGLLVVVFPEASADLRPMTFNMSLKASGTGSHRRWLVESWSPRGGGGGRSSRSEGSSFDLSRFADQGPTKARLGTAWLLFPAALIALGLLLPVAIVGGDRLRSRRAQRAYDASRPG